MATSQPSVSYREIPGFPGYRIGDDGSVWSCRERVHVIGLRGSQSVIGTAWHRLRVRQNQNGYAIITIRARNKTVTRLVHQLVLETFVGPCPSGMEACHFPYRNKTNNALSNLRWDTKVANAADRVAHGNGLAGDGNPRHKLTEAEVIQARATYLAGGISHAGLASRYGITSSAMGKIIRGAAWRHLK